MALRILLVNSERGVAGGLSSSVELAEGLAARGALITVVCHPDSSLRKRLDAGGRVQVAPVAIRAELNAWRAVQIAHVLERARHDVIIADRRKDVKLSLGATLLRPGPALVHRHGAPSVLRDSAMYHTIWTRLDGMIVNSHRMKRLLLEATPWLAAIPIDVIHNGKDMARFRPRPDLRDAMRDALGIGRDRFVIAFHGVLQERKRLDVLLHAMAELPERVTSHALIVGDGPDARALREMADQLDVPATFTGMRVDLTDVLAAADVAVNLSSAEGFSNSVIEAMACGLGVIASDATSHDEQIENGVSGILVPIDATAVARGIGRLMANRGSIAAMGRAARLRAEQVFGIDVMIDAWIGALERAIARHRTRHS